MGPEATPQFFPFYYYVGREGSELDSQLPGSLLEGFPATLNIVMNLSIPTCSVFYQESGNAGVSHRFSND